MRVSIINFIFIGVDCLYIDYRLFVGDGRIGFEDFIGLLWDLVGYEGNLVVYYCVIYLG